MGMLQRGCLCNPWDASIGVHLVGLLQPQLGILELLLCCPSSLLSSCCILKSLLQLLLEAADPCFEAWQLSQPRP
jgi:hypothetical protein